MNTTDLWPGAPDPYTEEHYESTDTTMEDQILLEQIVRAIVSNPDEIEIDRTVDEMGVLLRLRVDGNDMGKLIGRDGAMVKAIRTLLRGIGMKHNARVNVKLLEPYVPVTQV
jgi:predicted RNA-binding protein YlqC (UPF0109 family)